MRNLPCLLLLLLSACRLTPMPTEPPPLRNMEEPIALKTEPDDESARQQLPLGSFSGLYVKSAWFETPDEPGQEPDGLEITRVVENSPADAAELRVGDILLATRGSAVESTELHWPAQWRGIETNTAAGTVLLLDYDRAGDERTTRLTLIARIRPATRKPVEMFREERHAGIVLRTATEVEARAAGLDSGGGAVLIGLAANSPWRQQGLMFGDVLVEVGDQPVHHPQVLLSAIRTASIDAKLAVRYVRNSESYDVAIPLTSRESDLTKVSIPLLFSYEASRGRSDTSFLLGLLSYESTAAAWEFGFLWLFSFGGGDSDELREVKR